MGRITKTQGLKGAFRVYPHSRESANLHSLERIVLAPPNGEPFAVQVISSRSKGEIIILTVRGVDGVERAQELVGGEVLADPNDLEPLDEGEFYWYEVVGMEVVTDEGERLGTVQSIIPTGANDVLQVKKGKQEILLPNIPDVILDIDREDRRITVHLLPGLR